MHRKNKNNNNKNIYFFIEMLIINLYLYYLLSDFEIFVRIK